MQIFVKNSSRVTLPVMHLALFSLLLFVASGSAQTPGQDEMNQSSENVASVQQESLTSAQSETAPLPFSENSQFNFAALVAKTIGYLTLIVLLIILTVYVLKRFVYNKREFPGRGKAIQVLGSTYIGPKKSLMLVDAAGRILIISVTDAQMNLITELKKEEYEEYVKRENTEESISDASGNHFRDILHKYLKRPKV